MDRERLVTKTEQALSPLETDNVITFLKGLTVRSFTGHPEVTGLLILILVFALWRWTRQTLLTFFTLLSLGMLIRYTFPPPGVEITFMSALPFVLGCMGISAVLLYFLFIRTD